MISDGYWIWRLDLPYYVEKYQIQLDGDFLRHVVSPIKEKIKAEAEILSNWMEIVSCYEAACGAFKA